MLKLVFKETLTTDLDDFNATNKNIALQIVSGREGISLAKADYLIFLNLQFSAVSYFQAKDRLTTMERKSNDIYWIFAENGIEEKIYKRVLQKLDYTHDNFKKDFNVSVSNKNKRLS
jgi:ERCC4-related helicase